MSLSSTADKYRDLVRQSHEPKSDIKADVVQTHPQKFEVRFFTAIDPIAKYLLVLDVKPAPETPEAAPVMLLVPGSDLYTCAVADEQGTTLIDGVRGFLKLRGFYEGIESLHVEVHKLTSSPILEMDHPVQNHENC